MLANDGGGDERNSSTGHRERKSERENRDKGGQRSGQGQEDETKGG